MGEKGRAPTQDPSTDLAAQSACRDALVVGLGPGGLVSVLTPLASEGSAAAPPSLLVLNKVRRISTRILG